LARLSVNINKIATLRNARGGNIPDLIQAAIAIEDFGAEGITVHPRPDERHIRYADVYALKGVVKTEFNIEGYPSPSFLKLIEEIKPEQVTLVPDPPDILTSNAGWDTIRFRLFLADVIARCKSYKCRVSLFIDPSPSMIENAVFTGTDRVELYTEAYAKGYQKSPEKAIQPYIEAANTALACNIKLNAGHDLNLQNLAYFTRMIPGLEEVSIGHALISDALYFGLRETVIKYKQCLNY
jgi:pyridoxine 5-phosphate synthase